MRISELESLGFKPIQPYNDQQLVDAYCGDLLSDVVANAPMDSVLITIQGHKNTIAVASLAGIKAVVLVNGAKAEPDMLSAAREENIALFSTSENHVKVVLTIAPKLFPSH